MACQSCENFRQQGHNFCGVCGKSVETIEAETQQASSTPIPDPILENDLRVWAEQGWTIETSMPCTKCGNPKTCSRVETHEEEKGYNPGTTIGCNPLVLLLVWLLDTLTKKFFPPRIVTMNADRIVCPRCKDDRYENSRIVSERPLR